MSRARRIQGHVSRVIDDGGTVRLYLGADSVDVLESADGIHFKRTGRAHRRRGLHDASFSIQHDPDPARRYKLFHLEFCPPFDPAKHGVYASYSADGVNFTKVGRVLPFFTRQPDDRAMGRDSEASTSSTPGPSTTTRRISGASDGSKPTIRSSRGPIARPTTTGCFSRIENVDVVLSADDEDDPHSDIYYNAATIYPWAADTHLMFTSQFRHFSPQRNPFIRPHVPGQWEDFGMLEVQLAVSRDGDEVGSAEPRAVLSHGPGRRVGPLVRSDGPGHRPPRQLSSTNTTTRAAGCTTPPCCGRSTTTRPSNSAASASSDSGSTASSPPTPTYRGGYLRTPPIVFSGNMPAAQHRHRLDGHGLRRIPRRTGQPDSRFCAADCEEIGGNFIDQRVYWKGKSDVSSLAGKPMRLRINLKRGKLYAFQFVQE